MGRDMGEGIVVNFRPSFAQRCRNEQYTSVHESDIMQLRSFRVGQPALHTRLLVTDAYLRERAGWFESIFDKPIRLSL